MDIKMPVDISCEELLTAICTYCGWLRKERKLTLFPWGKTYCVLSDRCFYYFKNENSKKPKGKFPLYGFNKVKRKVDETIKWSFILEHVQPNQKNYVFAASSQQEMVEWMKYIKEEMLRANNRGPRTTADGCSDSSGGNYKHDSLEKIEEKIYDDFMTFQPVSMPSSNSSDSDSDDTETDKRFHKLQKQESERKLSTLRIPVLPIATKKSLTGKEEPPRFCIPKMPERRPAEGQPNIGRAGYEHVDKIAVPPKHLSSMRKQPTPKDYWNSIYYHGDKDQATKIIENIAKDGVFLVRNSDSTELSKAKVVNLTYLKSFPTSNISASGQRQVNTALVVYSKKQGRARKYRISIKQEDSKTMYYMKTELLFETVEELIYHYCYNSICTDEDFKLTEPYLLINSI